MSFLGQCLRELPSKDVRAISARLFPKISTWGRVAEISLYIEKMLLDEEFLVELLKKLNDQELGIVSLFVWGVGADGMSKGRTEALLTRAMAGKPMENLASLMAQGIIFKGYAGWGDHLIMPEDLAAKLSLVLIRNAIPRAVPPGDNIAGSIFTGNFYEDCLTFMAYVHKNQVVLTQKGFIRKKTVGKLSALMQFKEDPADIPVNLEYPFRFYLLVNYCLDINAIYFENQMMKVQIDSVKQWLKQKPLDMISKALSFIWSLSLEDCPNPHVDALMKLIVQMKENWWYGFADLAGAAGKMFAPFTYAGTCPETFLEIMLGAGLLVEGASREGERLVRLGFWSPRKTPAQFPELSGEEDGFWVQPNFEVLAPPRLKPALRWQLEMVADPVKVDQSFTYALTREATMGFFDRGGQTPDMIGFLEKYSKNALPQNVLFTIREWGALYGRVSFWDVFLLRCDDEQLADEIAGHPKLKPYVHGRFDPNHLIVARNQYESLLEALQKQGYFPRKGIFKATT